jgi:hypothetical protein
MVQCARGCGVHRPDGHARVFRRAHEHLTRSGAGIPKERKYELCGERRRLRGYVQNDIVVRGGYVLSIHP